jgi:hypothetical protein
MPEENQKLPAQSELPKGAGGAPWKPPRSIAESSVASAQLLACLLHPDTDIDIRSALEELTRRNRELLDGDNQRILNSLAEQLQLLEAIFQRYTYEALKLARPDQQAALAKVAFNAQAAYVRAAALLVTARGPKRPPAVSVSGE